MKNIKLTLIIASLVLVACSTSKKAAVTPVATNTSTTQGPLVLATPVVEKPITPPGNEELAAIQAEYKDVTMEKLKEGYTIFTAGACINCHTPVSSDKINDANWKNILDDMAQRAQISDVQKDAVNKYMLSVKAAQKK